MASSLESEACFFNLKMLADLAVRIVRGVLGGGTDVFFIYCEG